MKRYQPSGGRKKSASSPIFIQMDRRAVRQAAQMLLVRVTWRSPAPQAFSHLSFGLNWHL